MDLGLNGKVAMVAGASKGMGRAIALALAREGARVAMCSRDGEKINDAAEAIQHETGAEVRGVAADVSRADDIDRFVEVTLDSFGTVHILVTNAGGPPTMPFIEGSDEQWQRAVELTLLSVVRLSRAVIPHMQKNRWGRIIHIGSYSVKQPIENLMLSNSIRAAVVALGKTQSIELARDNILVNSVLPGSIQTGRGESIIQDRARRQNISVEEARAANNQPIPLGRMGTPEEFANVVAFLASDRASYVNGVVLQVDGGLIKFPF